MKTGTIIFRYFEKGDFIRTSLGVAKVMKDESPILSERMFLYSKIKIRYLDPYLGIRIAFRKEIILINKEEYEEEKKIRRQERKDGTR